MNKMYTFTYSIVSFRKTDGVTICFVWGLERDLQIHNVQKCQGKHH